MSNLFTSIGNQPATTTSTSGVGEGLSGSNLRPINDLTRTARIPGELQYDEYIQHLRSLGHVRRNDQGTTQSTSPPSNSLLQINRGDRTDDMTDFRADQALWTMDNLPEILYSLSRPAQWLAKADLHEPPTKKYIIYGHYLRDIPVLPDHISSNLEGWRYEAWMRMDPRIGYSDIIARVAPDFRPAEKSRIQMRTKRFREAFPLLGWVTKGKNYEADGRELVGKLQRAGIEPARGSTRGLSWGLVDPAQGQNGRRVPIPAALRQMSTIGQPVHTQALPGTSLASSAPPLSDGGLVSGRSVTSEDSRSRFPAATGSSSSDGLLQFGNVEQDEDETEEPETPPRRATRPRQPPTPSGAISLLFPRPQALRSEDSITPTLVTRVTVRYAGRELSLRTAEERANLSSEARRLLSQFHPAASEERARQLEFVLDPSRVVAGFVDNHGFVEHCPADISANCTDQDVIYTTGPLASYKKGEEETR